MIVAGQSYLQSSPHISLVPAVFLCLTILSLNLVGDVLRSRFDVRPAKI
jgi:peptide/nickel transport system permease protein